MLKGSKFLSYMSYVQKYLDPVFHDSIFGISEIHCKSYHPAKFLLQKNGKHWQQKLFSNIVEKYMANKISCMDHTESVPSEKINRSSKQISTKSKSQFWLCTFTLWRISPLPIFYFFVITLFVDVVVQYQAFGCITVSSPNYSNTAPVQLLFLKSFMKLL